MNMKNKFLPVILGTDANAYGLARSFYEEYMVKSLALGKMALKETKKSKILTVKTFENLDTNEVFNNVLENIGKEYSKKYIILNHFLWDFAYLTTGTESMLDGKSRPLTKEGHSPFFFLFS